MTTPAITTTSLHGGGIGYVQAGSGPVVMLVHGIAGDWRSWTPLIEPLAARHTVVVPDLPGHGGSEAVIDCSIGGLAATLRDLLVMLGHERATIVGHSLGGGVAMQFAYLFPEMTERLALISSGGLGADLSPMLRAAALPGAGPFIATTAPPLRRFVAGGPRRRSSGRRRVDLTEIARGYASLADRDRRRAFLAVLRGMVSTRGQRISAVNRLYLGQAMPVLIIWGSRDAIIPARHAEEAHRAIPGSRLELLPGVRHFPQLEEPERTAAALDRFLAETEPARLRPGDLRALLLERSRS